MSKTTQRAFALSMAVLFGLSTIGFSAFFIWQMTQESNQDDAATQAINDAQQSQEEQQQDQPKDFMKDYEPIGDDRIAELRTEDKKVGDGKEATNEDVVVVEYTGALASDGSIFDSTDSRGGEPAEFPLDQVIPGFRDGIAGMKVGGERRIFIPAEQGYGSQEGGPIPADSDLVFDVKLLEVK